jgi:hypothetical protein
MRKYLEFYRTLTVNQSQLLAGNINGDLFHNFTRGSLRRGFSSSRLPVTDCQNAGSSRRCNISTRFVSSA